jgi:hypothetical protein
MDNITSSLNDISYRQVIRKLTNGIEDINLTRGKENNYVLIDSYIYDPDEEKGHINITRAQSPSIHDTSDKDNPNTLLPDNMNWTQNDDGKWIPPKSETKVINKIQQHAQSDSGANRIVTDNITQMINVTTIPPLPAMGGCNKEDKNAIICTAMGLLPIQSASGEELLVHAYYSAEVDGTIISPTTIVTQNKDRFSGWMQHSKCNNKSGYIMLIARDSNDIRMNLTCKNDLWYHHHKSVGRIAKPRINKLGNAARYELWHQRTAHAGQSVLDILHKHAKGVPRLHGNAFYKCPSCMSGKLSTKRAIGKNTSKKKKIPLSTPEDNDDDIHLPEAQPGQHFHMDLGFVRGSDYNYKTERGTTVTSIDNK